MGENDSASAFALCTFSTQSESALQEVKFSLFGLSDLSLRKTGKSHGLRRAALGTRMSAKSDIKTGDVAKY